MILSLISYTNLHKGRQDTPSGHMLSACCRTPAATPCSSAWSFAASAGKQAAGSCRECGRKGGGPGWFRTDFPLWMMRIRLCIYIYIYVCVCFFNLMIYLFTCSFIHLSICSFIHLSIHYIHTYREGERVVHSSVMSLRGFETCSGMFQNESFIYIIYPLVVKHC